MLGKITKALFYIIFCLVFFSKSYTDSLRIMQIHELSSIYAWGIAFLSLIIIFFALRAAFNRKIPKIKRFAFSLGFVFLQSAVETAVFAGLSFAKGGADGQDILPLLLISKGTMAIIACVIMAIFVALVLLCEKLCGKKSPTQEIGVNADSANS
jgi:hypothetical protein